MPSVITDAFQEWNVNKVLAIEPAVPDQMIFALIPGLDASAEIDPGEGMPDASQIVYTSGFTRTGKLNENAVVYSVVLDTTIGNWSYNWVGIVDSATGTVLMIVHCDKQQKIKTGGGQQGNNLIRNMVMEFAGAAEATKITVTPASWQIDYSARHAGSDGRVRVENIDVYGTAAFEAEGFMVTAADGKFQVAPGLGYIHGLRCYAESATSPGALTSSTKVWVDATWQGTPTGAWVVTYSLRIAPELENYEKDGFAHFVFAIAETDGTGNITDLRPPFPLQELERKVDGIDVYDKQESDERYLQSEQNLSDLPDRAAARTNLDVYSKNEAVPAARMVNGKKLDDDVELTAGDVGAVPITRTVNGNKLDADITLSADDVGALPIEGGRLTGALDITGKAIPTDYGNFDERYLAKSTQSTSGTGWHKDGDTGLITQWGLKVADGYVSVTFPIAFPNAVECVMLTRRRPGAGWEPKWDQYVGAESKTGFSASTQDDASSYFFWEAKGR